MSSIWKSERWGYLWPPAGSPSRATRDAVLTGITLFGRVDGRFDRRIVQKHETVANVCRNLHISKLISALLRCNVDLVAAAISDLPGHGAQGHFQYSSNNAGKQNRS